MRSWITLLLLVEEEVGEWAMRKLIYHDKKLQTREQFTGKNTHYLTTQLWKSFTANPDSPHLNFCTCSLCADRFDPIMIHQSLQFFWTPYSSTWHQLNFPLKVLFSSQNSYWGKRSPTAVRWVFTRLQRKPPSLRKQQKIIRQGPAQAARQWIKIKGT